MTDAYQPGLVGGGGIYVRTRPQPTPQAPNQDDWGDFTTSAAPKDAQPSHDESWSDLLSDKPVAKNTPQVGAAEAAGAGIAEGMTFGTAPIFEGLSAAAGPEWNQSQASHEFAPFVGAAKMFGNVLSGHPDPAVRDAYERGRKDALDKQNAAREQHPIAYGAGQLAGAVMTPIPGLGGGAGVVGRLGRAALGGTIAGGLGGAGEQLAQERPASEVVGGGIQGAVTGGAFGAGGAGLLEAGRVGAKALTNIGRGIANPETEAARKTAETVIGDVKAHGPSLTPEEIAAADAAGTPRAIVDYGATGSRRLMQAATNASPEAGQAVDQFVRGRFAQQADRIAGTIRRMTGAFDAKADDEALRQAARTANGPLYRRAYAVGNRVIGSPQLNELATAPAVKQAMEAASERGQNRAVADRVGNFDPTKRNLQFWDYTQRELRDAADAARRAGRNEEAGALEGLHRNLLDELDKQVPEFANARGTSKLFFGARDALEAGQLYVSREMRPADAARALSKMSPPERELFARGFASELANKILDLRDRQDVINQAFLSSPNARAKIQIALGKTRADELEALLRAETVLDRPRQILGNSTTARQTGDLKKLVHGTVSHGAGAVGGAGALSAFEYLKEHEVQPATVIAGALVGAGARHGLHVVDERVARRVGELIVSNDFGKLAQGLKIVTKSPKLFNALRVATGATTRTAAHKLGLKGAFAGASALHGALFPEGEVADPTDLLSDQSQQ